MKEKMQFALGFFSSNITVSIIMSSVYMALSVLLLDNRSLIIIVEYLQNFSLLRQLISLDVSAILTAYGFIVSLIVVFFEKPIQSIIDASYYDYEINSGNEKREIKIKINVKSIKTLIYCLLCFNLAVVVVLGRYYHSSSELIFGFTLVNFMVLFKSVLFIHMILISLLIFSAIKD